MDSAHRAPPILTWLSRNGVLFVLTLVALAVSLAASIGVMFVFASGQLMLVLVACWVLGAGAVAYRWRTWFWPALCPLAMLTLVLLWEIGIGPESWASTFVFMLGVVYIAAAAIGAAAGTWLGKRRRDFG